jgi:hypothetical protein
LPLFKEERNKVSILIIKPRILLEERKKKKERNLNLSG